MDTQRLILFVIFSFSALFLWEAWQKEHAPPPPPATAPDPRAAPTCRCRAAAGARAGAAAGAGRRRRRTPGTGAGAPRADGQPIVDQDRPLHRRGRHRRRRHLARRAHRAPRRDRPRRSRTSRCSATPSARSSRRPGCSATGMPNHRTRLRGAARPARARRRAPTRSSCRLQATAANGDKVVQVLTFHRGSYVIDVAYDITNAGSAPITPYAYFQLTRDTKHAGRAELDGAGVVHRPGRLQRARTSSRRSNSARSTRRPPTRRASCRTPKNADNGWVGMVEHYFVAAWLPSDEKKTPREFYTTQARQRPLLGRRDRAGRHHRARARPARCACRSTSARRTRTSLAKLAKGLDLVVDYGIFTIIAAPLFWLLKWLHGIIGNWGWSIIVLTIMIKSAFYPLNARGRALDGEDEGHRAEDEGAAGAATRTTSSSCRSR